MLENLRKDPSPKANIYDLYNLDDGVSSSSSIDGDGENESHLDLKKKPSKKERGSKSPTTPNDRGE